mgnify:CR=1 FL=1
MNTPRHTTQRGFSLLELAIALAVLAILTGGVLKGRELLNSAKVQAASTDLANLETAVTSFQSRYAALPGDFAASNAAGLGSRGGDGNGLIEGDEETAVFTHLQRAGFIQGDFVAPETEGALCDARSCMESQFGGIYLLTNNLDGPSSRENALAILIAEQAQAKLLAELDRKLDDGNPNRGSIQVLSADAETCVTGDAWNEANDPDCGALYFIR